MHVAQYGMRRFDTRPVRSFSHLSASGVAAASAFTIIHRRFTRNRNRTRLIFRLLEYRSLFSIVIGKFGGEGEISLPIFHSRLLLHLSLIFEASNARCIVGIGCPIWWMYLNVWIMLEYRGIRWLYVHILKFQLFRIDNDNCGRFEYGMNYAFKLYSRFPMMFELWNIQNDIK